MCWGVGEVRGDAGKGEGSEVREMWGKVGGSVLGPHTSLIPLPTLPYTPPPFLSSHPSPT